MELRWRKIQELQSSRASIHYELIVLKLPFAHCEIQRRAIAQEAQNLYIPWGAFLSEHLRNFDSRRMAP
jgi:hypothetical protein